MTMQIEWIDPEVAESSAAWRELEAETNVCPVCDGDGGWLVDITGRVDYQPGDTVDEWVGCFKCDGIGRVPR